MIPTELIAQNHQNGFFRHGTLPNFREVGLLNHKTTQNTRKLPVGKIQSEGTFVPNAILRLTFDTIVRILRVVSFFSRGTNKR